jgi:hypothetical protein
MLWMNQFGDEQWAGHCQYTNYIVNNHLQIYKPCAMGNRHAESNEKSAGDEHVQIYADTLENYSNNPKIVSGEQKFTESIYSHYHTANENSHASTQDICSVWNGRQSHKAAHSHDTAEQAKLIFRWMKVYSFESEWD